MNMKITTPIICGRERLDIIPERISEREGIFPGPVWVVDLKSYLPS